MANILLILTDDQRFDELRHMPNTRRMLAGRGTNFTGCRTNCSVCGPTRSALMTGQLAKPVLNGGHGITTGGGWPTDTQRNNGMYQVLGNAGYRVGHVGKALAQGPPGAPTYNAYPGMDFWRALDPSASADPAVGIYDAYDFEINTGSSVIDPGNIFQDYYLAGQALDFLRVGTEPWFLEYCPTANHWPWTDPPNHATDYALESWELALETDVSDKPTWIQGMPAVDTVAQSQLQDDQRHRLRELQVADDAIGMMVAQIHATGQADDTTIFFTSDNGMMLGEHRIMGGSEGFRGILKNTLYDPSLRAPLIAWGPGFNRATVPVPTQQQDIVATIHDITGTTPLASNQSGVSLLDIAANPTSTTHTGRHLLHKRNGADAIAFPSADAITTYRDVLAPFTAIKPRKLIRNNSPAAGTDIYEMYDLDTDPGELVNVAYVTSPVSRLTERNALDAALTALGPV